MKKANKKTLYILSILIPFLIVSFIYLINHVYPFGNKTIMKSDMYSQMYPMLINLYDSIKSGELIYSFKMGLGAPFYRDYFYYVSSPINFIVLLFRREHIHFSIPIIIGIKFILSSLSMMYYLIKKHGSDYILLIPSLMYAFSGFISSYFFIISWTDVMFILPLITLGIEKLIEKKDVKLYVISLAIMIVDNYYMAYMVCVWCVIYFLAYNLYRIKKEGGISYKINELSRNFLRFLMASLLSAGIVSMVIIPIYCGISGLGAINSYTDFKNIFYNVTFIDFLTSNLSFIYPGLGFLNGNTLEYINSPNIYVGLIFIMIFPIFCTLKTDDKYTKHFLISLILLIIIIFKLPLLNYIINVFHIPNQLPFRYSYIYSFIASLITAFVLKNQKGVTKNSILISGVFLLIYMLILITEKSDRILINNIYLNFLFLIVYFLIIFLSLKYKYFWIRLLLILIVEISISLPISMELDESITTEEKEILNLSFTKEGSGFNRIYDNSLFITNDGYKYNFNLINSFSSNQYTSVARLWYAIGGKSDFYSTIDGNYKDSELISLLFGIAYEIDDNIPKAKPDATTGIFAFNQQLSLEVDFEKKVNPFDNQNKIVNQLGIEENLYDRLEPISFNTILKNEYYTIIEYTFDKEQFYYNYDVNSIFAIEINDKTISPYFYSHIDKTANMLDGYLSSITLEGDFFSSILKSNKNNMKVATFSDSNEQYDNYFYKLNEDVLNKVYEKLKANELEIISYNTKEILTESNYEEEKDILVTLPYDKGWHVYIDDEETEMNPTLMDALITFKVPKGRHRIKMVYKIPYLNIGIIISMISVIILIVWNTINKRGVRNESRT